MGVETVYMQCNISDSQALLCCFVLINLRMASTDTLFLCSVGQQLWTCSQLVLIFFSQNQAFCFYKIVLIKRVYMSLLLSSSSNPTELCQGNFNDPARVLFAVLKNIVIYFLNNAGKICSHGQAISENVQIKHVFCLKHFFISENFLIQVASAPLSKF